MEYRVEEIARAAGVSVDTVRFYQARGLLPPPERRGRVAIYTDAHLDRLRRIRTLNREGVTLDGVRRLLEGEPSGDPVKASLLDALAEAEGRPSYTRAELAATAGVPELLLQVLESAGLLEAVDGAGYGDTDVQTLRAARLLLETGFPLDELLPLARAHAEHTTRLADQAIELFDRFVRRPEASAGERPPDPSTDEVTRVFRELLPAATALVALHFQRTLIQRARARLSSSGDDAALEAAIEATAGARLQVGWSSE